MVAVIVIGVWITFVLTRSMLFLPLRVYLERWPMAGYLASCPLCMGTWVGGIVSYFVLHDYLLLSVASVSLSSYLVYTVADILEGVSKWHVNVEVQHQGQIENPPLQEEPPQAPPLKDPTSAPSVEGD